MGDSPLIRQYNEQKALHPDSVLFFRMGDFYEMYGEDARFAAAELGLTLGSRPLRGGERIALCGVPSHAAEAHIRTLVAKGFRVAVCEQQKSEDAGAVIKRGVVRIVTPGSLLDTELLDAGRNNYIAAAYLGADGAGFAAADISTGVLYTSECGGVDAEAALLRELGCYAPRETLLSPGAATDRLWGFLRDRLCAAVRVCKADDFDLRRTTKLAQEAWPEQSLDALGFHRRPYALRAAGAILGYLRETSAGRDVAPLTPYVYERGQYMQLDPAARADLELCEGLRSGGRKGSLLAALDDTVTAMGSRTLRGWLERPLMSPAEIGARQGAVRELFTHTETRARLRAQLALLADMERLLLRVATGQTRSPQELLALRITFARLPDLRAALEGREGRVLHDLRNALYVPAVLRDLLDAALAEDDAEDDSPFRRGYDSRFDNLRAEARTCREAMAELEQSERTRSGIKSLKLGRHKQYGYYIEVPKNRAAAVPSDYEPRQSLSGHERFVCPALRSLEARLHAAESDAAAAESALAEALSLAVAAELHHCQRAAQAAACLDALCSFAETAANRAYVCPRVDYSDALEIRAGRHPVVERAADLRFVPNDTSLASSAPAALITGPNMAGKSTYLRQCALIVLMAQAGCFVPAAEAHIGVADRIFTRVGASDDLAGGSSTFMVEMCEVADILRFATDRSLLILDEVGRGTSTYDGLSVARAVLEHIDARIHARTLFATHYRELCELERSHPGIRNYHITAEKQEGGIVFTRRIVRGAAEGSFGVEAAALAGLPDSVITRAREILAGMEGKQAVRYGQTGEERAARRILDVLRGLRPDNMTPFEALSLLVSLRSLADKADAEDSAP